MRDRADILIVMTWSWRYEAEDGKPVGGPNETFSSQADAESWLGQTWKDRVAAGAIDGHPRGG